MRKLAVVLAALAAMFTLAAPASGEVSDQSEHGFVSENTALIDAPPAKVWQHLVEPALWWNGAHSWSGDAANFSLDARAGGCFCEQLSDGGSVEHLHVVHVSPHAMLRLNGALGPLQSEPLAGVLTIELLAQGQGTRVKWTYIVGGFSRFPLAQVALAVDGVQREQLSRLALLVETGQPTTAR